jgi:rhodanese-related sulfurtransferase
MTIDEMLRHARAGLRRLTATEAWHAARTADASLVDIRPSFQRRADGEIPGAIVIERVHLEWRLDPTSPARIPEAVDHGVWWVVCCDEGYSSSLAAASLQAIGLHRATDVLDGFRAWLAAGLPVIHPREPTAPRLYRHEPTLSYGD